MGHRDIWNFARGERQLRASTAYSCASTGVEEGDNSRVFVGGLPRWISTHELWESFEVAFGKVIHAIVVCRIDETGEQRSRGFGFVRFGQQEDANEALKRRYVTLGGRRVEVKRAVPRIHDSHSGASTANSSGQTSQIAARLSAPAMTSYSPGIRRFHEVRMQQSTSPDFLKSPPVWSMPSLVQRSHDLFSPTQSSSIAHTLAYTSQPPVSSLNAQTNFSILQRPADDFREMAPSPTKYTEVGQASNTSRYRISRIPGFNPHRPVGSNAISGNHASNSLGVTAASRGVLNSGGNPHSNVMRMFPPHFNNP